MEYILRIIVSIFIILFALRFSLEVIPTRTVEPSSLSPTSANVKHEASQVVSSPNRKKMKTIQKEISTLIHKPCFMQVINQESSAIKTCLKTVEHLTSPTTIQAKLQADGHLFNFTWKASEMDIPFPSCLSDIFHSINVSLCIYQKGQPTQVVWELEWNNP